MISRREAQLEAPGPNAALRDPSTARSTAGLAVPLRILGATRKTLLLRYLETRGRRRAMATEEGDAQYSAHRSGSDAQDSAPAPPGITQKMRPNSARAGKMLRCD